MSKPFQHIQTAHCENGVITSLAKYHGLDFMTEPLAFGMGAGLFFLYVPYLTVNNGPFVTFRALPGSIFSKACRSLKIPVKRKRFSNEVDAETYLNQKVAEGMPVGCQVGVFHLPYFPPEYRFHFNAHNLIVYGRENGHYKVSDPVMENVTTLTPQELSKVRFAKGILAPKGHLYYLEGAGNVTPELIRKAIKKGINRTILFNYRAPGPVIGATGIKFLGSNISKWRDKMGPRKAGLHLGQVVRMQEEIGTGGGGFRFLYAAFLEQATQFVKSDGLLEVSEDFTKSGDLWRSSAVQMAGIYKGRLTEQKDFDVCADILAEISDIEYNALKKLTKMKL